jgi:hypothetical protein
VFPQCGVIPNISGALFPKKANKIASQSKSPKPSISRATKKAVSPVKTKPVLTKKGQGSFNVLGTPTSKVD